MSNTEELQAEEDLDNKLQLEDSLILLLIPFFQRIASEVGANGSYSKDKVEELNKILLNHYRLTANKFSLNLIDRLMEKPSSSLSLSVQEAAENSGVSYFSFLENVRSESQDLINNILVNQSSIHSNIILSTTDRKIESARNKITNSTDEDISEETLNQEVALILSDQAASRSSTIAATETQLVSETTKMKEATDLNSFLISAGVVTLIKKMWKDRDDDRVRPWHRDVDGQTQFLNQPFIVKGESLMHPGDRTHGASLNNVINCRCSNIILL